MGNAASRKPRTVRSTAHLAIGPDDQVWRSIVGLAWSPQAVGPRTGNQLTTCRQSRFPLFGGRFVVGIGNYSEFAGGTVNQQSGHVGVSSDATTWRQVDSLPAGQAVMSLLFDGHRDLAAGGYMEASSADDRTWTGHQVPGLPDQRPGAVRRNRRGSRLCPRPHPQLRPSFQRAGSSANVAADDAVDRLLNSYSRRNIG
jgi:hypothetical protein